MGRRVAELACLDSRFKVIAGVIHHHSAVKSKAYPHVLEAEMPRFLTGADLVVDFSTPEASVLFAEAAARKKKPVVIGTTGFDAGQMARIKDSSKRCAVFLSPNFSPGMNVLLRLAELAAAALPGFDAGIYEVHHVKKVDAPSGTAARLAKAVQDARRSHHAVPIVSQRLGSVVGDHTLVFSGSQERLELVHRAESRDVFAKGALEAAAWAAGQKPGLYDMRSLIRLP
jgi:4-hydroxy-tetrahydrodipicolinate reductase